MQSTTSEAAGEKNMNKRKEPNDPVYSRFLFFFLREEALVLVSLLSLLVLILYFCTSTPPPISQLWARHTAFFSKEKRERKPTTTTGAAALFFFFLSSPFCASGSILPLQQHQKIKTLVTAFSCLYSQTYSASMGVRTAVGEFALFVDRQAYVRVFDLRRTTFCFAVVANTTDKKKGDWSRASFFER